MFASFSFRPIAAAIMMMSATSAAYSNSFAYHGTLKDNNKPAEGNYDLRLTLYSSQNGNQVISGPITMFGVPVHAGSFNTDVDLGPLTKSFSQAWVGVEVRAAGIGTFSPLSSRSQVNTEADTVCPGAWTLVGNAGNPAGSYLGTADDQPLILKANGQTLATFIGSTGSPPINSVALGNGTTANGYADFAAGDGTSATGPAATALGAGSSAIGHTSFAAGQNAVATHDGSFVWADDSSNSSFGTTAVRQFLIRATGGVGIGTNNPAGTDLMVQGTKGVEAINTGTASAALFAWQQAESGTLYGVQGITSSPSGYGIFAENLSSAGGTALYVASPDGTPAKLIDSGSGAYLSGGGTWTNASDRNLKSGFNTVDAEIVLAKVIEMPVTSWFYKSEGEAIKHMGPVAQDFRAAFGLGGDDKSISTVDEGGVALAAIKGLNSKLEVDNAELRGKVDMLQARLDRLESDQLDAMKGSHTRRP